MIKINKEVKTKIFLFAFFIFWSQEIVAQVDGVLKSDTISILDNLNVLADKNYSFSQILNNRSLRFTKAKKILVKGLNFYWIKYTLKNNSAYDKNCSIWAYPWFDCTLYSYNENSKNWQQTKGGEMVANNQTRFKYMPCVFRSNKATTFYIKVSLKEINNQAKFLKTAIVIENQNSTLSKRNKDFNWWLATVSIVLAFLIYNAYWYLMIKEKVYLYYLTTLAGGIIYITCANGFLSLFTTIKSINATVLASGGVHYIPIEFIVMQTSTLAIMYGFVAFTRTYLQSKTSLPQLDRFLKAIFLVFALLNMSITIGEYTRILIPNNNYPLAINIAILVVIITILIMGFKSCLQKRKEATYFLLALILPLLLMIALVIKLTFTYHVTDLDFLPNIAILSIAITFAVALVAKVNLIKAALIAEKIEKQNITASIAIEKEKNIRLQEKIEYDKNEVYAAQKIKLLMKELHHRVKNNLQIVSSLLSLQSFRIKDQAAFIAVQEGQRRIEAMSLIHQRLYIQDNVTQVNIKEFITDIAESLMQAYGFEKNNFQLDVIVKDELLEVDKAIPLSIIINELITNAFKYAYNEVSAPSLKISLTKKVENVELLITDNGQGINIDNWKTNDGYGKELIQTFTQQIEGSLTVSVNNGTTFKIVFPF